MIPIPGVRVWLVIGRTDMRRRMNGLALKVQALARSRESRQHVTQHVRATKIAIHQEVSIPRQSRGLWVWSRSKRLVRVASVQLPSRARNLRDDFTGVPKRSAPNRLLCAF